MKAVFALVILSLNVLLVISIIKSNDHGRITYDSNYCYVHSDQRGLMQCVSATPEGNYTSNPTPSPPAPSDFTPGKPPPDYTPSAGNTHEESSGAQDKGDVTQQPKPKSGCLIATAAFGSELSPQVQFLRNFRDTRILSTVSGSTFMNVFNAWYYSFSPSVADYERGQPWLQGTIRLAIYPLLGILQVSEKAYSILPGEYGSILAGLTASMLIGLVYFTPLALCIKKVTCTRKSYFKLYAAVIAAIMIAILGALLTNNLVVLMISTPLFVVILCATSSVVCARMIMLMSKKLA